MFVLFNLIISILISILSYVIGVDVSFIGGLYSFAILLPSLALCIKRLHDVGKSGAFILINFIPGVEFIWFLILVCTMGDPGENTY
ncbi:Uncharacterized membrane protein YhaH, DUF805 family [Clostridium grantii DSM 8605]|uniref:Uncharacterized membrane protein YhaH, DUF805 family n=2 Tax=Clostridium TaxID=1485 RepID=A0A1M5S881_9CLOT|nr:Uncharacterized membrane protein YhaH, DUF805 family [Clostridium grantii DSM 8605]